MHSNHNTYSGGLHIPVNKNTLQIFNLINLIKFIALQIHSVVLATIPLYIGYMEVCETAWCSYINVN